MASCIVIPCKSAPSERLPGKNCTRLLPDGETLLARACGLAVSIVGQERVYISVDGPINRAGCPVVQSVHRHARCGPDLVHVMRDAIQILPHYDQYILLQVTNPFVEGWHLQNCVDHPHNPCIGVNMADHHCGGFYAAPKELWREGTDWYDHACWLRIDPSVDIDTPEQWDEAVRLLEEKWRT